MSAPIGGDTFRSAWLALPVAVIFDGVDPRRPRLTIEVRADDSPVTIESRNGEVWVEARPAQSPDLILTGPPDGIVDLLMGVPDGTAAANLGVRVEGDVRQLRSLRTPQQAD
jgi:hypothetical protein